MEPLPDFDIYGPGMYLHSPTAESLAQKPASHPILLVFCTFMGASLKIVGKYTQGYRALFPHTSILLITSNISDTFTLDKFQAHRTTLAAATILDIKVSSPSPGLILLHAMSNGGATAAARIAQHLHDTGHPNTIFTYTIMDSAPSHPRLKAGTEAMIMQFPFKSRLLKRLVFWSLYVSMGTLMFIVCDVFRREDMVRRLRRRWNDSKLFEAKAPRLYLFSKVDKLIPFEDVRDHVRDAREKGWGDVREEMFERAPHCALVMEDKGRYWGAIEELVLGEKV